MVSRERAAAGRAKAEIVKALQGRDIPAQGNALGIGCKDRLAL